MLLYAVGSLGIDDLLMGWAPSIGWLFLGRAVAGIAGASCSPAYACVADVAPPEKHAQSFGVISACFGIGFILGPAIGGLLSGLGPRAPFFVAAALSLANFAYGWFSRHSSASRSQRSDTWVMDWRLRAG